MITSDGVVFLAAGLVPSGYHYHVDPNGAGCRICGNRQNFDLNIAVCLGNNSDHSTKKLQRQKPKQPVRE